jgi:hypothetical protein
MALAHAMARTLRVNRDRTRRGRPTAYVGCEALCALTMMALLQIVNLTPAVILHAIAAPVLVAAVAVHDFGARGARDPLPVALMWTSIERLR